MSISTAWTSREERNYATICYDGVIGERARILMTSELTLSETFMTEMEYVVHVWDTHPLLIRDPVIECWMAVVDVSSSRRTSKLLLQWEVTGVYFVVTLILDMSLCPF